MELVLLGSFFGFSFCLALLAIKIVLEKNKKKGIMGIDINKKSQPRIPESAGIALLAPVWASALAYLWLSGRFEAIYWALMVSVFSLVGYIDDHRQKFFSTTIKWSSRALIIAFVSLAFSALFFGNPLLVVLSALFVAGIASFQNTFAGLNGWEVGSGFIVSVFAFLLLPLSTLPLAAALSGAIFALLFFNVFPAKAFPGDSGTLLIGSALAGLAVMSGNIYLMGVFFLFFIPHIVDFVSKLASNAGDASQRKTMPYALLENSLLGIPRGKKTYDFAKLLIRLLGPMTEKKIVLVIWAIVVLNCSVVVLFFS